MDEKGLGKRLQQMRQAANYTQQELCARANISYSTLAKIERGAIKAPSIFTVQGIAEALGVGLDQLLGVDVFGQQSVNRGFVVHRPLAPIPSVSGTQGQARRSKPAHPEPSRGGR